MRCILVESLKNVVFLGILCNTSICTGEIEYRWQCRSSFYLSAIFRWIERYKHTYRTLCNLFTAGKWKNRWWLKKDTKLSNFCTKKYDDTFFFKYMVSFLFLTCTPVIKFRGNKIWKKTVKLMTVSMNSTVQYRYCYFFFKYLRTVSGTVNQTREWE